MPDPPDQVSLVGDVGGTNARFALVGQGGLEHVATLRNADHAGLREAVEAYLAGVPGVHPRRAAVAVACPVAGGRVELTNLDWSFEVEDVRRALGLETLTILNDFEALALALPDLLPCGAVLIQGDPRDTVAGAPRAVLGPGTGLGVAALVEVDGRRVALSGEGGHRDFAASNEREWQLSEVLRRRYAARSRGHLSAERVLSGPGLVAVYEALCELDGDRAETLTPAEVVAQAASLSSARAAEAVGVFCAALGAVAGDIALTLGAHGGVFLGGGVLGKMGDAFDDVSFTARFEEKGRFRDYLRKVPVYRITHPQPGLLGTAWALCGG